ncbi:MAG: hypothetical protein RPS47_11610 [Colwellia sp.]|jgi:hypothetical protein
MTISLDLNQKLQSLKARESADANNPGDVASSSFLIIKPSNLEAVATVQSGGNDVPIPKIPAGFAIPYPVTFDWNDNSVSITNGSGSNEAVFETGYFGMPADTNDCVKGDASLKRFQSTIFRTPIKTKTLELKCTEPAIVALIVGTNLPMFIALNVDGSALTGPYGKLVADDILECKTDGTYEIRNNFSGATIAVVNISNGSTPVQVRFY